MHLYHEIAFFNYNKKQMTLKALNLEITFFEKSAIHNITFKKCLLELSKFLKYYKPSVAQLDENLTK